MAQQTNQPKPGQSTQPGQSGSCGTDKPGNAAGAPQNPAQTPARGAVQRPGDSGSSSPKGNASADGAERVGPASGNGRGNDIGQGQRGDARRAEGGAAEQQTADIEDEGETKLDKE